MVSVDAFTLVQKLVDSTKAPTEIFSNHISNICESINVQTISSEISQKNVDLFAKFTFNEDFIMKFQEALQLDIPNLIPLMDILLEVSSDRSIAQNILGSRLINQCSDYENLKKRLLNQVQTTDDIEKFETSSLENVFENRLFPTRKYLTMNFLECNLYKKYSDLNWGSIPIQSQEILLIDDILCCLSGTQGNYLKTVKVNSTNEIRFIFDCSIDSSLKELILRILPLCEYYSRMVSFAEDKIRSFSGRVNQALAGALYFLIKDYLIFLTQLETQNRNRNLTINKLWVYIQPTIDSMYMIANICEKITQNDYYGGKTLSLLYQQIISYSPNDNCYLLGKFLLYKAAKPYFEILQIWINRGIIVDNKDFFVVDNEVIARCSLPREYSDDYWEKRYALKKEQIPSFLYSYADIILKTGKYLNVIRQCDKTIKRKEEKISFSYSLPEKKFESLENAFEFSSRKLLDLLVKDKDLVGHLKSVKHYFLLDQGDFIVQFMDLCETELLKNVNLVEPARLESLLELAQRTSAANSDPYKDNVLIDLLPYDLIFQMFKILSIDTNLESEFKNISNNEDITGLEAFAFGYNVQWPVSLILNTKSLVCYQMLLRQLLYCKHIERSLCKTWISSKYTKKCPKENAYVFRSSEALRQKMLNFLQNLEYYMTFEIIEPSWEEMIYQINHGSLLNVDQVLEVHSSFLSKCLNDCMLSNPHLLTSIKKLMKICLKFSEYIQTTLNHENLRLSKQFSSAFQENTTKFDLQFSSVLLSLLDRISQIGRDNYNEKIIYILNRLDFNGFYLNDLEKFESSKYLKI